MRIIFHIETVPMDGDALGEEGKVFRNVIDKVDLRRGDGGKYGKRIRRKQD